MTGTPPSWAMGISCSTHCSKDLNDQGSVSTKVSSLSALLDRLSFWPGEGLTPMDLVTIAPGLVEAKRLREAPVMPGGPAPRMKGFSSSRLPMWTFMSTSLIICSPSSQLWLEND